MGFCLDSLLVKQEDGLEFDASEDPARGAICDRVTDTGTILAVQWCEREDLLMCCEYPRRVKSRPHDAWIRVVFMMQGKLARTLSGEKTKRQKCEGRTLNNFLVSAASSGHKRRRTSVLTHCPASCL
jgi:hypothetical protein